MLSEKIFCHLCLPFGISGWVSPDDMIINGVFWIIVSKIKKGHKKHPLVKVTLSLRDTLMNSWRR